MEGDTKDITSTKARKEWVLKIVFSIVPVGDGNQELYIQQLLDAGHIITSEDEYFIVLENIEKYP